MKQLWGKRLKQLEHFIASATAIQADFKRRFGERSSPKTKA
jgi:hypothetical protein